MSRSDHTNNKKFKLKIATCQFAVSGDIKRNALHIKKQLEQAKKRKADIVHFSEAALSGYMGSDIKSWDDYDWKLLKSKTEEIIQLAGKLKLWVILGSSHKLSGKRLPYNSLYVINSNGKIIDRYDKRFCTTGDSKFYTPGNHFSVFRVNGIICGLLICYDLRFPEIYRKYKQMGVQVIFNSFYNARASDKGKNIHKIIIRSTLQARAATNYVWISANNSSGYYQSWPGVFIRPDGEIIQQLRFHRSGVMVNIVDVNRKFYDAAGDYLRNRAMRGILHS